MTATRRNGFTLVELLVTLALAALLVMVSLPHVMAGRSAAGLDADARLLAARLRLARETALATRQAAAVTIDLAAAELAGPAAQEVVRLHTVQQLRASTARGPVEEGHVVIGFAADGSSSGGVVVLESGSQLRRVSVDWLTGQVRVSAGRS